MCISWGTGCRLGRRRKLNAETGVGQCHVQRIVLRGLDIQAGRCVFLCHSSDVTAGRICVILVEEYLCLDDGQLIRDTQRRQPGTPSRIFQPEPELLIAQFQLVSVDSFFKNFSGSKPATRFSSDTTGTSLNKVDSSAFISKAPFIIKT